MFPTWLIITLSIVATIALAVVVVTYKLKLNARVNVIQRKVNRLQDLFAAAGAVWMSQLLSEFVVGSPMGVIKKLDELIEADDTVGFFMDKIAGPCSDTKKKYDAEKRKAAAK